MRQSIGCQKRKIVGETSFQFEIQRVVARITVGNLRVDRTERRNDARSSQSSAKLRIQNRRRNRSARQSLREKIIRRIRTEEIGNCRSYDPPARRIIDDDDAGNDNRILRVADRRAASKGDCRLTGFAGSERFLLDCRQSSGKALEVLNLQAVSAACSNPSDAANDARRRKYTKPKSPYFWSTGARTSNSPALPKRIGNLSQSAA